MQSYVEPEVVSHDEICMLYYAERVVGVNHCELC
jgi:hypothetical protein